MMDMKNKIFAVENVSLHDLEEHLNELAADHRWVLHSIDYVGRDEANLPSYTVIAHRAYNWELKAKEKREKWELTMGTTGGHANE
jgi:hypothetical protein